MTQRKKFVPGRGYAKTDWDAVSDNPELTVEDFARALPFAEAFPDLAASIRRGRGPQKTPKKVQITLRLDPVALAAFKATGKGWQVRIDEVVKRAANRLKTSSAEK